MTTILFVCEADPRGLEAVQDVVRRRSDWDLRVSGTETPGTDSAGPAPDVILASIPAEASPTRVRTWLRDVAAPIIMLLPDRAWKSHRDILSRAADFLLPPYRPAEIEARLDRWIGRTAREDTQSICDAIEAKLGMDQLIGGDDAFLRIKTQLPVIARADATVLVTGETGTGKEAIARALHYLSGRARGPFVPVNCGAVPVDLFESELFGHRRGAFTGAVSTRRGVVAEAERGTLFLDEIDAMPLPAQVKLHHILQNHTYRQLGGGQWETADIRVIAASNADLEDRIADGSFRADLFYRLNIIPLRLPPLRERSKDVAPLAKHFLRKYVTEYQSPPKHLTPDALATLAGYAWPGNVRELENVVQRAVALNPGGPLDASALHMPGSPAARRRITDTFRDAKAAAIERFERDYVSRLLDEHAGNITRAARAAGAERRAFGRIVKKLGLKSD